jgi:hypothetical protein
MRPGSGVPRKVSSARRVTGAPFDVALAATLHDPTGVLLPLLRADLPRLRQLYRAIAVTTSPPTSARVNALLAAEGVYAGTPARNTRGPLYRASLRGALASKAARVHYLDADRAIHWVRCAPRELAAALRVARRQPVLVLGRTPKAHRSHQLPLVATEAVVNRLMAARAGLTGRVDLLVPSFVLTRAAAQLLCRRSGARDAAMYGEWAALLCGLAPEIAYLECRGLDWETPDRDPRGVRRLGLRGWRRRFETPGEWRLRVDMAGEFVAGFARTAGRFPCAVRTLRRVPQRAG